MNTRWVAKLTIAACLAIFHLSCSDDDGTRPPSAYSFEGSVTDSISGVPLDSASISYSDPPPTIAPYYSDSTGHYRGAALAGRITIFVHKSGYVTQSRQLHLDRNLTGVNFRLLVQ